MQRLVDFFLKEFVESRRRRLSHQPIVEPLISFEQSIGDSSFKISCVVLWLNDKWKNFVWKIYEGGGLVRIFEPELLLVDVSWTSWKRIMKKYFDILDDSLKN